MKKIYSILLIIIVIIIISVGLLILRGSEDSWICQNGEWVKYGMPLSPKPDRLCPQGSGKVNQNTNTNLANPASTYCLEQGGELKNLTDEDSNQYSICVFSDKSACEEWAYFRDECQSGNNLAVFTPSSGKEVVLPFKVRGQARVFENTVNARLEDKDGNILFSAFTNANSPDMGQYGDFEFIINNLSQISEDGQTVLKVYWLSPKDGAETDLVSIPLTI